MMALAVILTMTACHPDDPDPTPGPGPGPVTPVTPVVEDIVVNGTKIQAGNNAYGLISDATTGKGIPGVPVSDGYNFTTTDDNGVYQFSANRLARKIFYTTPADYKIALNPTTGLPQFFNDGTFVASKTTRYDFKLEPLPSKETKYTMIMIGDPQCKTDSDVNRWKTETIPDLHATVDGMTNVYAMTLGDITFDNTVQWDPMDNSMRNFKLSNGSIMPIFNCIGNHDHDAGQSEFYYAQNNFINHFGPVDYSFDRNGLHVIVMDDVYGLQSTGSTWNYASGFTANQFKWLKQDIALVKDKSQKTVFLCCHIPFRNGGSNDTGSSFNKDKNYTEVLNLLAGFKEAHIMIGHTHYNQNYVHTVKTVDGNPIYEHIHGAACGAWWSSQSNVTGGPNGYTVYTIENGSVTDWYIKGTKRDKDFQMRVYDGNDIYDGSKGYKLNWYTTSQKAGSASITVKGNTALKYCFVAEVFNDDDTYWKVELFKGDQKVGDFKRLSNGSCCNVAAACYYFNELGKNTTTWSSTTASHYWYYRPTSDDPSSETGWTVRATQTIPRSGITHVYECSNLTKVAATAF
jgi:Predicted phosphohydrolases